MHDLIREMALQIMKKKQQVMVKAGIQLTEIPEEEEWTEDPEVVYLMNNKKREMAGRMQQMVKTGFKSTKIPKEEWYPRCPKLPTRMLQRNKYLTQIPEDEEEWTKDLEVVSLMYNNIEKIPYNWSPRCPKLSTLMLQQNIFLTRIPDSFFVQLCGLRVLNLSYNENLRDLPNSVGDLINLIALWLYNCYNLNRIPSLGKLKELRYLDFSHTEVRGIPDGIGELKSLRSLRCLNDNFTVYQCPTEEVMELQHLEEFRGGCVRDVSDYNVLVRSKWFQQLSAYRLYLSGLGGITDPYREFDSEEVENVVCLDRLKLGGRGVVDVPHGIKGLAIVDCYNTGKCLLKFGLRGKNARTRDLKVIRIRSCKEVEWVVAMPSSSPDVQLPGIEELYVEEMENMKGIFNWWEYCDSTPSIPNRGGGDDYNQSSFSKLNRLHIYSCHKMKVGLTVNCLMHLPMLTFLIISDCSGMEEIIGGGAGEDHENNNGISISTDISLPKLKELKLRVLPSLRSIYNKGNIICDSIYDIELKGCTELKRLPLTATTSCYGESPRRPFLSLRKIYIRTSEVEWWESLELVDPTYHPLLQPFLHIEYW